MANVLNRHDPATAIPMLEKQLRALNKGQAELKEQIGSGVPSAQTMHRLDIYSTRGNMLRGGITSTELKARLYSWDVEVTKDTPAEYFRWTRNSGDEQADAVWNNLNGKGVKNLIVVKEDVGFQSTFLCTVSDNDKLYVQAQIVISTLVNEDISDIVSGFDERITAVEESSSIAISKANEAKQSADSALTQMDSVNAEIAAAKAKGEELEKELDTLTETLNANYATKGELTAIDTSLQAEIQKNASQISTTLTKVEEIEIDASQAVADAQNAQQAAQTAKDSADTAQRNYELLRQQADATDEQLAQAKAQVQVAQEAAQIAQDKADTAKEAADSLVDRVTTAEASITQQANSIELLVTETTNIKENYATAEEVSNGLIEVSTQISQVAEEIALNVVSGYTTVSDLEEYKKKVENLFKVNEEGVSFEFSQLEEKLNAVGNEVTEQKQYIRLIEGEIHIGKADNPITSVYTNDALEFRYNGQMVARFTNEVLEVRNISVENQVAFFDQWAIRRGAYVEGVGYNLNDIWIGG